MLRVSATARWMPRRIGELNSADFIIVSRNTNSGDYNNGTEGDQWDAITTDLLLGSAYLTRSNRWGWVDTTGIFAIPSNDDCPWTKCHSR